MRFFYSRFAWNNIVKNKQLVLPYIFASIFTIASFYILGSIALGTSLNKLEHGSAQTKQILSLGLIVIAIFSMIFLFYTYSFLIKRRIKEFGLYAVLGMTKKQIAKILMRETIFIGLITLTFGLAFGIMFGKVTLLALLKLFSKGVVFGFDIPVIAVVTTIGLFGGIYFLILLYTVIKISRLKIITLLKEGSTGEKEPKARFILTLIGIGLVGYGYYTALTAGNPIEALTSFFYAVMAVILGTYLIFMTVSITVLKIMKNNKRYYYKPKHFISVSGLLYRMKRNAVGLANICILSTMVLVTMGATSTMYAGVNEAYENRYPRDISVGVKHSNKEIASEVQKEIDKILKKHNVKKSDEVFYNTLMTAGEMEDGKITAPENNKISNLVIVIVSTLSDYNKMNGENKTLKPDEVLLYLDKKVKYQHSDIQILNEKFKVKEKLNQITGEIGHTEANIMPTYYIVVKDESIRTKIAEKLMVTESAEKSKSDEMLTTNIMFNIKNPNKEAEIVKDINNLNKKYEVFSESKYENKDEFKAMFASFLFIGIFISLIFIVSQVVIMYYKQISEGYEDKNKFSIMRKVGLTEKQIKQSIRSQVLLIFFAPLVIATIHTAVAFPFIEKIMNLFLLKKTTAFLIGMSGAVGVFTLFYLIVYVLTSRVYYRIIKD
ncbi:peptide ABC transporter permease [Gemella sp. ND 6198]|uniref:ABC transporter permease n=1 Tax=Gemella sp. ND 6198 TaxID=2040624 RepID=UPI000E0ADD1F|nr:ABC transporter permease [Gemella sp. ND 6198]AXI26402.1 peptide ABC transporter permease [Gemella sp. ND 6198]